MTHVTNAKRPEDPDSPTSATPDHLPLGENLVLYSQYILVVLLVLAAAVLRVAFGAP